MRTDEKIASGLFAATSVLGLILLLTADNGPPPAKDVTFQGPKIAGNSCYIDSTLFAIFAYPENPVAQALWDTTRDSQPLPEGCQLPNNNPAKLRAKVRKALKGILNGMHTAGRARPTCTNFRTVLAACSALKSKFYTSQQQDAVEFFHFLLDFFGANTLGQIHISEQRHAAPFDNTSWVERKQVIELTNNYSIHLPFIRPGETLLSYLQNPQPNSATLRDESGVDREIWNRRIVTEIKGPFFIAFLDRYNYVLDPKAEPVKFIPDQMIGPPLVRLPQKPLYLQSVVCYTFRHFVTFVRHPIMINRWYFYDDLREHISLVGSYRKLLTSQNALVTTKGCIYFYW